MESTLERVLTVHQTSMGATRLPLELQQQVFSYLDTKSFYAARNVCKWWRFASVDSVTLSRQLKKLPILPPVDAATSSPHELQQLWSEAAYTLMLGTRTQRQTDSSGTLTGALDMGFTCGPKVTSTTNGKRTVTLNDRRVALYDTAGKQPRLIAQRPLNDLKETVGSGPWLKVTPTSYHELALSSDGRLLAVAQERTVQIYDLLAEPDSFTVNEYISSAAGHYICGLDFEQNDHVLRVRLSGKGSVLYLGSPVQDSAMEKAGLGHWKSKAGLKHIFLDSARLTVAVQNGSEDHTARVSGLQLLRPLQDGYMFAGQKHGGNESSYYILGHVKCSILDNTPAFTAEPESVTVLTRLESFLSAWDYTLNGRNESGMGLWENMPSAHEHHPSFAMSPDGSMIVLAERDKKAVRPTPLTQLFIYRLPSERRLLKTLQESEHERTGQWPTSTSFLDRLEDRKAHGGEVEMVDAAVGEVATKHSVARIPTCLSTIRGAVTELKFEQLGCVGDKTCMLSALTADATKTWTVEEL